MCITGSIKQLGKWETFNTTMTWTQSHIWKIVDMPVHSSDAIFQYKYVVINDGQPERWEEGFNRIADLKLLAHEQKS